MIYKFEALPCINDEHGRMFRPYAIDGEVIYTLSLNKLFRDEAMGMYTELLKLVDAISTKIGTQIKPEAIVEYLKNKQIETKD